MVGAATPWNWGKGKLRVMSTGSGFRHCATCNSMKLGLFLCILKIEKLRFRELEHRPVHWGAGIKPRSAWISKALYCLPNVFSFGAAENKSTLRGGGSRCVWGAHLPELSGQPWSLAFCYAVPISALVVVVCTEWTWWTQTLCGPPLELAKEEATEDRKEEGTPWPLLLKVILEGMTDAEVSSGSQLVPPSPSVVSSSLWLPPPLTFSSAHQQTLGCWPMDLGALLQPLHQLPLHGPTLMLDAPGFSG